MTDDMWSLQLLYPLTGSGGMSGSNVFLGRDAIHYSRQSTSRCGKEIQLSRDLDVKLVCEITCLWRTYIIACLGFVRASVCLCLCVHVGSGSASYTVLTEYVLRGTVVYETYARGKPYRTRKSTVKYLVLNSQLESAITTLSHTHMRRQTHIHIRWSETSLRREIRPDQTRPDPNRTKP